jgi:hypothetical protein
VKVGDTVERRYDGWRGEVTDPGGVENYCWVRFYEDDRGEPLAVPDELIMYYEELKLVETEVEVR